METVKELLRLQTSGENQNTSNNEPSELVKKQLVEGTGFEIVTVENKGSFIVLGKYRLTDIYETEEECREMIKNKDWELILGLMGAVMEHNHVTVKTYTNGNGQTTEVSTELQ